MTSIVRNIDRKMDGNRKPWGRRCISSAVFVELEKITENFTRFAKKKKKAADLLTNLLDLQNSSDHTQPQQIIANYTLCLQVVQDYIYNIMYHSILRWFWTSGVLTVLIPAANQATALPENVGSSASLKSAAAFLDCRVKNTQFSFVYFYEWIILINTGFT